MRLSLDLYICTVGSAYLHANTQICRHIHTHLHINDINKLKWNLGQNALNKAKDTYLKRQWSYKTHAEKAIENYKIELSNIKESTDDVRLVSLFSYAQRCRGTNIQDKFCSQNRYCIWNIGIHSHSCTLLQGAGFNKNLLGIVSRIFPKMFLCILPILFHVTYLTYLTAFLASSLTTIYMGQAKRRWTIFRKKQQNTT